MNTETLEQQIQLNVCAGIMTALSMFSMFVSQGMKHDDMTNTRVEAMVIKTIDMTVKGILEDITQ